MKYTFPYFLISLLLFVSCTETNKTEESYTFDPDQILTTISKRVDLQLKQDTSVRLPRNVEDGNIRFTSPKSWTSGFFPGMLWMLAEYNNEADWDAQASSYTEALEEVQYVTDHHDLGFMLYNSYGKGYQKLGKEKYKQVLINGANSLASRYTSLVGMIKSWDRPGVWQYPVIIDNMMNLEYFFWIAKETGDSSFYQMAYSHAINTMEDHYRDDVSCYHVVDYDTLTGESIWKGTHQGLADESVWARGQAWGLYGFAMAYRETNEEKFLVRANEIASYLMNHPKMPEDKIPYWDLADPTIPEAPRDASAGAIIASALIELSAYAPEKKDAYLMYAKDILANLDKKYRYKESSNASYFYLDKSVGNKPKDKEVSVPIIYADYYFIEALLRLKDRQ